MKRLMISAVCLVLAGCGATPDRVAVTEPTATAPVRIGLKAVELRDLSLPGYAAADEISVQGPDGTLVSDTTVLWADTPVRAVSLELSRHLAGMTRARFAPSPWPFETLPDGVLDLRFETLLARADGNFHVAGQYFLGRLDGGTERSGVFDLTVPIEQPATALTISAARGKAIVALANDLARRALR